MNNTIPNEIRELIDTLNKQLKAYDEGKPIVSDKEWDENYFRLEELEKRLGYAAADSPTQRINYEVVNSLKKVKHNHPMLSLAKSKDWDEFLHYFSTIDSSKDVVGMLKLDGLTLSLRYVEGKLVSAETRGNGEEGEDVLHNAQVISSIPKYINYKEELIIDGEIICTYKDFEKFKGEYKNPRNFASGSIRLLSSKECASRNLTFVVWNVVKGLTNSLLDNFNELQTLGFTITPFTSSFDWDAKDFLQDKAKEYGYPIDGLVGRFEDREFGESLGATGHHSKAAFAFKFYDEIYQTALINIEYEPSRNGQLTPVAIVEPVEIEGSTIERCNLHNISIMEELNGGNAHKGDTLYIYKANSIIPECSEWTHTGNEYISIPEVCPVCGGNTEIRISESGVKTLWCTNDQCDGRLINKLEHMYGKGKIEIKGLSKATFEKLIELGWINRPRDIFEVLNQKQESWKRIAGFGTTSVEKIIRAIEESKNCKLEQVICAAGIPLIGKTVSKTLAREFKTWDNFREAIIKKYKFYNLEGFGIEMHNAILNFNYSEIDYIAENFLTIEEEKEVEGGNALEGLSIAITGKLNKYKNRSELQAVIEQHGGKVTGSVSKKTSYLINNDKDSNSAKNKAAAVANVPIISEDEFIKKFLTF